MFFQPHFDFITILGEDLSRPLAGKIYFKELKVNTVKFHPPSLVIINTTTTNYYNTPKRKTTSLKKMPENRKDTEIYIRKLHEMLPELKEKYHISYLGIFGSYIRGEQKLGSDLDILVEFSKTPTIFKFVNLENHLSEALGVKVDLVMKDALKPNIGKHIMREVEAVWRGIKIREAKDYVKDIYDAMEAAEEFASGWTFEDFAADRKTQFAVIRALEIIGEATKNIPYEAREKYPSVPWKDLAGIWDKLIHAYFGVNLKVVWLSVKEGIPEAKPDIKRILDEMWIRKTSPRGKDHFDQKRSCKGLVLKLQKLWIKKKVDSNNKIF